VSALGRHPLPVRSFPFLASEMFCPRALMLSLTIALPCASGCAKDATEETSETEAARGIPTEDVPPERPSIAHVPVGEFFVGSTPGEPGRVPGLEPSETKIELGPFRIDTRLYPGKPGKAPKMGVTASEAAVDSVRS